MSDWRQDIDEARRAAMEEAMRERDEARAIARRLATALEVCDGHRGAFSCSDQHDLRCLKARGKPDADCECGRDELDAAVAAFDALPWAKDRE